MVRAAAKNHEHVYVVVDPADYSQLVEVLSGTKSADEVSGDNDVVAGACM